MNATTLEVESSLTDRYQTTVPEMVRTALGVGKRDKLIYRILPGGVVTLAARDAHEPDQVMSAFLAFLDRDIADGQKMIPVTQAYLNPLLALVDGVDVDLDHALAEEDE